MREALSRTNDSAAVHALSPNGQKAAVQNQMTRVDVRAFQKLMLPGALLLLASCAPKHQTVLKGDTAFEMQSSIQLLAADLPADRRNEFDRAVETIIFSATDRRLNANGDRLSPQAIRQLKGRTVAQVIEDAKLLRAVASY